MKLKDSFQVTLLAIMMSNPVLAQEWSIDSCLSYAKAHNKDILASEQSIKSEELNKKSFKSQLAPEIDATAGIDHNWKIPVQVFPGELLGQPEGSFVPIRLGTPWMGNYGVEARLALIDPQSWQDIKLATLQHQASQSRFYSLQKALSRNVSMAYYQAQQQLANIDIANNRHDNYKEIHRLIVLQFDKGLIDKITYNQSLNLLNERENALLNAEVALQTALIDLKFWMGYPLEEPISISEKGEISPTATVSAFNPSLLPDYTTQKLQVERADRQYQSALSQRYPSLHLTSGFQKLGFGQSIDFIGQTEWFASGFVGFDLRIPLLSLSKAAYGPKKQRSELKVAHLQFENYLDEQEKKYLQASLQMEEAWESVIIQRENVKLAEENERLSRKKVEKGIIDMLQLKQIQQDLNLAQEKLNITELDFLRHLVEINYLQSN